MIIVALDPAGRLREYDLDQLVMWDAHLGRALADLEGLHLYLIERGQADYYDYYKQTLLDEQAQCQRLLGAYYRAA